MALMENGKFLGDIVYCVGERIVIHGMPYGQSLHGVDWFRGCRR